MKYLWCNIWWDTAAISGVCDSRRMVMNGRGHTRMTEALQNMPYSDRFKDPSTLSLTKRRLRDGLMTTQTYSDRVQKCRKGELFNLIDRAINRAGDWMLTPLNSDWEGCAFETGRSNIRTTSQQMVSSSPAISKSGWFDFFFVLSCILFPRRSL